MLKLPQDIFMRAICAMFLIVFLIGCANESSPTNAKLESEIHTLVSSEELILLLTPELRTLERSLLNLQFPGDDGKKLFATSVQVNHVRHVPKSKALNDLITSETWEISQNESANENEISILDELLDQISYFEHVKCFLIDGIVDESLTSFDATIGISGLAKCKDGTISQISITSDVQFSRPSIGANAWKVCQWIVKNIEEIRTESVFFSESMSKVIVDTKMSQQLAHSKHEENTRRALKQLPLDLPKKYPVYFPEVALEHPSIAVIDLNNDGFDDFYLTSTYSKNMYFENLGNGTFEEKSASMYLDIKGRCSAALFVDVDNDGDQDLFLGRARDRAMLLINEDGKFLDMTKMNLNFDAPYMVSAFAAADYDNDGLVDVYLSTYSPIEGGHVRSGVDGGGLWTSVFLSDEQEFEYSQRAEKGSPFLDVVGPPNLLLHNKGNGEFEIASANETVGVWKKTLHAGWSDFDKDGDQDLYVCNDFSIDDVYRNMGGGEFERVNEQLGFEKLGFGMGLTWGDYNNDGNTDLYVSNMYSKAGKRITAQFKDLNPQLKEMATGNYLYEGLDDGTFKLVSSADGAHKVVSKAGWSWGGQFVDVDNNGKLDIHVGAGYYTAPAGVAEDLDL